MTTTTQPDYMDKVPANQRGYFHTIAGAAIALLTVFGYLNGSLAAAIGVALIAAIDLVLVLMHTRANWRKALYPVLYAGGSILVIIGVVNEVQIGAILGLALAVLGTQFAAAKTPVPTFNRV